MFTLQQAIELATKAHKGQWRRPVLLSQGPGILITDRVMSIMMYDKVGELVVLPNGNKLTYCRNYKQWHLYEPYITHPLAVMDMMTTEEEKIVAVLHDVIEDTYITFDDLELAGISENCLEALMLLTHTINEDYSQYISKIHLNKLATKVKLADMFHNMSCNPSEHAKQKYLKAIPILLQNI